MRGERRIGFQPDSHSKYLSAINTKYCARPNSSAPAGIVSTPLAAGSRSRCWLLKGADDSVHDSSEAAAPHLQPRKASGSAADTASSRGRDKPSRAEPSRAEPALFHRHIQPFPGLKIEEVFVWCGPGERSIPAGFTPSAERQPLPPSAAPHARSSLTGRRSKFIWAPEKGSACV